MGPIERRDESPGSDAEAKALYEANGWQPNLAFDYDTLPL